MPHEPWQDDPAEVARAKEYRESLERRERARLARLRALSGSRTARRRLGEQWAPLATTDQRTDPDGRW